MLSVAFSPNSQILASSKEIAMMNLGSEDKSVRLWNVSDGKEKMQLRGHTD